MKPTRQPGIHQSLKVSARRGQGGVRSLVRKARVVADLAGQTTAGEMYRRIVETTHEGIWMADLEGNATFANEQMARLLGCTVAEAIGRPVFDFVFPDDHAQVRRHFEGFLSTRSGHEVEERLRRKDGKEIWVLVAASVFRDARGRPRRFLGMFTDITARKQTELELRHSQARLRLQIARMPVPNIVWNTDFRVVSWNPAAERMFGYSAAEAMGKHPYDLIVPPEVQPQVDTVWRRLLEGDTTAHSLNENFTRSGERIICEWSNTPLREGGRVIGVLSMVQDVTLKHRAEESMRAGVALMEAQVAERTAALARSHHALRESEAKYRRLFEAISDAVIVFDGSTRQILEVNEAACRLYGYRRAEFLDLKHHALTAEPEDSEASIRLTLGGASPRIALRYHLRKDKTVFPVEISASHFALNNRSVICGIIRDISERRRAEEAVSRNLELEREILHISEQERRRLGRDLHDDLCQQLAGIEYLAHGLAVRLAGRDREASGRVKELAGMLQQTLQKTRDLARGLSPLALAGDGLVDALRALVARTERVFRRPCRLELQGEVNIHEPQLATQLYYIAQEAVANAVKHARAGRITVRLGRRGKDLVLLVRDNGVGMPRAGRGGKGMGLSIMRYRAEVLGGSLVVERCRPQGTRVVCCVRLSPIVPSGKEEE